MNPLNAYRSLKRPNPRMQPDAVPASEIVPIFRGIMEMTAVPIESAARLMREAFGGSHQRQCQLSIVCAHLNLTGWAA